jgi:hypothetical protein
MKDFVFKLRKCCGIQSFAGPAPTPPDDAKWRYLDDISVEYRSMVEFYPSGQDAMLEIPQSRVVDNSSLPTRANKASWPLASVVPGRGFSIDASHDLPPGRARALRIWSTPAFFSNVIQITFGGAGKE